MPYRPQLLIQKLSEMPILLKYVNTDNNYTAFQPAHVVADLVIFLLFQHQALL